jgi:internalin A
MDGKMHTLRKAFTTIALTGFIISCESPYRITFNDRVLYNPGVDPTSELLADPNFQGCLNQVLARMDEPDPANITLLACPSAGIESLIGINRLPRLEQLDLSDNRITDIGPLANVRELRVLSIRDNDIRSITPLNNLPILRFVSLQGNDNIPCRQLDNLGSKLGSLLNRPQSCR